MSDTIIIIVVLALIAIVAMIAFNMYQEGKYRQQMRQQFGHSDKDALLNSNPESVRDGKSSQAGEAAKGDHSNHYVRKMSLKLNPCRVQRQKWPTLIR